MVLLIVRNLGVRSSLTVMSLGLLLGVRSSVTKSKIVRYFVSFAILETDSSIMPLLSIVGNSLNFLTDAGRKANPLGKTSFGCFVFYSPETG